MAGSAPPRQIPRCARNDSAGGGADEAHVQRRPNDALAGAAHGGVMPVIPRSEATRNLGRGGRWLLPARFLAPLGMTVINGGPTMRSRARLTGVEGVSGVDLGGISWAESHPIK